MLCFVFLTQKAPMLFYIYLLLWSDIFLIWSRLLFFFLCRCSVASTGDRPVDSTLFLSLEAATWGQIPAFLVHLLSRFVEEKNKNKNRLPLEYTGCPHLCCLDQHRLSVDEGEPSSCTRVAFYQLISPAQPTLPHHHGAVTTATRWTVSHQCISHNKTIFNAWFKDFNRFLLMLTWRFYALHGCFLPPLFFVSLEEIRNWVKSCIIFLGQWEFIFVIIKEKEFISTVAFFCHKQAYS